MKNDSSFQLLSLCLYLMMQRKLICYEDAAKVLNIKRNELIKLLKELPIEIGSVVVGKYFDGNARVLYFLQNEFREQLGFIHTVYPGGKKKSVLNKKYFTTQSIEKLRIIVNERAVKLEITNEEELVNVKLFINKALTMETNWKNDTDNAFIFLNLENKRSIESLLEQINERKRTKYEFLDKKHCSIIKTADLQKTISSKLDPFMKQIKRELSKHCIPTKSEFAKKHFLINTAGQRINIGNMIEIKRNL